MSDDRGRRPLASVFSTDAPDGVQVALTFLLVDRRYAPRPCLSLPATLGSGAHTHSMASSRAISARTSAGLKPSGASPTDSSTRCTAGESVGCARGQDQMPS